MGEKKRQWVGKDVSYELLKYKYKEIKEEKEMYYYAVYSWCQT